MQEDVRRHMHVYTHTHIHPAVNQGIRRGYMMSMLSHQHGTVENKSRTLESQRSHHLPVA